MSIEKVFATIDSYRDEVIELQRQIVSIPALSPSYGAAPEHTGEGRKVEFLKEYLRKIGIDDLTQFDAPDSRCPDGVRPNVIARLKGHSSAHTVWVMAHTDVVPPGDMSKWDTNPWELKVDGDRIYGRGVEDDHQGIVAGVMAMKAFVDSAVTPARDIALLLVADEECGSEYGIGYVLEQHNPLSPDDFIIVPDGGSADGSDIEVAEKSIAWIKFRVTGVQTHASTPDRGKNAMRAGANLIVALDELHREFDRKDPVFDPPGCTFEPTMKEANVPNINTIPGDDVFYLDCRVLPGYALDDVEAEIRRIIDRIAADFDVEVEFSFVQREEAAPATPPSAPVVSRLKNAIKDVYGVEARPIGIGGGTVAAYLRRIGLPCAVWSRMDETMHGPNENARVTNLLGDAKVIAHVALAE